MSAKSSNSVRFKGPINLSSAASQVVDSAAKALRVAGLHVRAPMDGVMYVSKSDRPGVRLDVSAFGGICRWESGDSRATTICREGAFYCMESFASMALDLLDEEVPQKLTELDVCGAYLRARGFEIQRLEDGVVSVQKADNPNRWLFLQPGGITSLVDEESGMRLPGGQIDLLDLGCIAGMVDTWLNIKIP